MRLDILVPSAFAAEFEASAVVLLSRDFLSKNLTLASFLNLHVTFIFNVPSHHHASSVQSWNSWPCQSDRLGFADRS